MASPLRHSGFIVAAPDSRLGGTLGAAAFGGADEIEPEENEQQYRERTDNHHEGFLTGASLQLVLEVHAEIPTDRAQANRVYGAE